MGKLHIGSPFPDSVNSCRCNITNSFMEYHKWKMNIDIVSELLNNAMRYSSKDWASMRDIKDFFENEVLPNDPTEEEKNKLFEIVSDLVGKECLSEMQKETSSYF